MNNFKKKAKVVAKWILLFCAGALVCGYLIPWVAEYIVKQVSPIGMIFAMIFIIQMMVITMFRLGMRGVRCKIDDALEFAQERAKKKAELEQVMKMRY